MAEPLAAIRVTSRFSAPPERVFNAWLDPEVAGKWLFATALRPVAHVEIDARVGGSFRFAERRDGEIIERTGEYIEIVPRRRLVFTLSIEDHPQVITRATVEITPLKTRVPAHVDPRRCTTGLRGRHRGALDRHPLWAWRDTRFALQGQGLELTQKP
jgi:uncharacterized protein YndB with AHSA1/START domain